MFWDAFTHNMSNAEWFGELSVWLLIFLVLRYGVAIHRIPNPDRQRGVNVRRVDGVIQLDLMCRRPPDQRCRQTLSREPQPSVSLCAD
ncbi:uncharacterized protein FMAN_12742 [Fusarium mangiferae]|uniref:Uncharacterized protein n=1 Tax=Fusarium mangiferae TaxID=192010 RepID=A0A1L7UAV9_FUSMA|nr:uncharacterized protein FMAN_12742 [Fusarium mangiferae]CVL04631.1 uncharacterized protein FMAN_12742 [Fusarium mangiferae]